MHSLSMSRAWIAAISLAWVAFAADAPHKAAAQDASATARRGTQLAEDGHCDQALTLLTKSVAHLPPSDLEKTVGFDGIKCAMTMNQMDAAADFVRTLQRDFPKDPQVLYVATHVYSDLSIRASQTLMYTAPGSYQVHELNAEALETQGKWDDAATEYRQVLKQDPKLPGMHYRLGRIILSKPPTATSSEEARHEFQAEWRSIRPTRAPSTCSVSWRARPETSLKPSSISVAPRNSTALLPTRLSAWAVLWSPTARRMKRLCRSKQPLSCNPGMPRRTTTWAWSTSAPDARKTPPRNSPSAKRSPIRIANWRMMFTPVS